MKKAVIRSAVIIGIAVLSVIFGIVFQNLTDKAERKNYPLEYKKFVEKYSAEYGVPENVIFAVIKCQSDFDSSLLSDEGEIGLMMVSPYTLEE
ncbi:MAG: transglycosylase SLT domain-containing protein, partial [Clostridia bacterium]|nr:transglycosylase SLT domain-containing protein [Clostridia bacterium]